MIPIEEAKLKLIKAMAVAVAQGWRIERGFTRNERLKCCCAIGALYVAAPHANPGDLVPDATYCHIAERHLGMNIEEATAFANGFDGRSMPRFIMPYRGDHIALRAAHTLGAELGHQRFSHTPHPL